MGEIPECILPVQPIGPNLRYTFDDIRGSAVWQIREVGCQKEKGQTGQNIRPSDTRRAALKSRAPIESLRHTCTSGDLIS